jgi:hypothetical protein
MSTQSPDSMEATATFAPQAAISPASFVLSTSSSSFRTPTQTQSLAAERDGNYKFSRIGFFFTHSCRLRHKAGGGANA